MRNVRDDVYNIVQEVKGLLLKSGVTIPSQVDLEISHHYGIDRFHEYGLTMMTICQPRLLQEADRPPAGPETSYTVPPGKRETFHVLYGELDIELNGSFEAAVARERPSRSKAAFVITSAARPRPWSRRYPRRTWPQIPYYLDPAITQNAHRKTPR